MGTRPRMTMCRNDAERGGAWRAPLPRQRRAVGHGRRSAPLVAEDGMMPDTAFKSSGALRSVITSEVALRRYQKYARATLSKQQRVNIRFSAQTLAGIRSRAAGEGMPYQTLVANVLHKYTTGRFVENRWHAPCGRAGHPASVLRPDREPFQSARSRGAGRARFSKTCRK